MRLRVFSPSEVKILTVLTERMVGIDSPDAGATSTPEQSPTVATIDAFVAELPLNVQTQLRRALYLFQWCPILFTGKLCRFTQLPPHDADAYIRSWAESRFGLRRRLFRGLRDVTFLGYYSQSAADVHQPSTDALEGR